MPGVHTYFYSHHNLIIYTIPMAQDHGLCRKKVSQKPAHGPPLQARVAAANRTVLQLANMMFETTRRSWRTWNGTGASKSKMNGAKQDERGQERRRAVGMAGKTQPAEQGTAGIHSRRTLRPAQASKQTATDGRPRSKTTTAATKLACLSPCSAGRWGECRGTGSQEGGLRPTYTVPTPPIAFACHCPYPLP